MNNKLRELKVTIPADKKSRESVAAGYVTDNNSGGYFVIECQECGAVYPSQHADGGGQIADTGDYNDAICPHCGEEGPEECENVGLAWNVQQAKIIALLAELEAKAQCITGLERYVKELEATLIAATDEVADLTRERDEARAKLATPVRLSELCGDGENDNEYTEGLNDGINQSAKAIRAAGFTVEGDE